MLPDLFSASFRIAVAGGWRCLNNDAFDATGVAVAQAADSGCGTSGTGGRGVHLDPKPALLEAMPTGWVRQQQTRFLNEEGTIKPRVLLVRRLVEFTNAYPWE